MLRRINSVNLTGTMAFLSLIAMVGFVDEKPITSVGCLLLFVLFTRISLAEDKKRK